MRFLKLFLMVVVVVFAAQLVWAEDAVDAWKRSLSLGYTASNGNTKKSELGISGEAKKTTSDDEIQAKFDLYNSRSNGSMDGQIWNALGRYSHNLGEEKMWFGSAQLSASHDKFAGIDSRITPALGLGRWISKADDGNDWNAYGEALVGYEMTEYTNGNSDEQPVGVLHAFGEKNIFEDSKITQDLTFTPSLEESQFKVKSETAFTTVLKANLSLDSRFIYEYNSDPAIGAKDTDTRWITGIKYDF